MPRLILEACVGNINQAIHAVNLGANRLEICENLRVGGTTPSYGTLQTAKDLLEDTDIVAMIRPRGGDFVYSDLEMVVMEKDIQMCKNLRIEAVAIGILNEYHEIDYENVYRMVKFAGFLNVVFHKAIDMVEKPYKEIRKLADVGITRILTSGGEKRAVDGIDIINRMVDEGDKYGIEIVVAGGVTKQNLSILKNETIANSFHGKKIVGNLIEEMEEL
jgi:copper homeostasis protein